MSGGECYAPSTPEGSWRVTWKELKLLSRHLCQQMAVERNRRDVVPREVMAPNERQVFNADSTRAVKLPPAVLSSLVHLSCSLVCAQLCDREVRHVRQ